MLISRKILKLGVAGVIGVGTLASLKANEYDLGSIGVMRLGRAGVAVFKIGRYYQENLYKSGLSSDSPRYKELKSECHEYGAQQLLKLCCANKGVYIKVGQHIGALDYILPPEYVKTLRVLHSKAPQSSFKDVLSILKEDLKKDPYEIFESIEKEPLGTASLAQVHKATLKDGRTIAVKVQHRAVKSNSYVDIKAMEVLVKITSLVFPEFKFQWLVDEIKKNIPIELNFVEEGKNAEKVQNMFKQYKWLRIPKIFWDLSSSRVLTMEFVEGGQVNDLEYLKKHKINPLEVTNKLGRLYSHMIFIMGFVHSDPHPGNILIRKTNNDEAEIILLDHGLYANLSNEFRWEYSKLWLAILDGNKEAMRIHSRNLGVEDLYGLLACMVSGRSWDTLMSGVRKKKYDEQEKELFQSQVPNLLPQISDVLQRVNRQMLLVLRTNDLVRCIEHTLQTHSRMTAFMEMSKCCVRSVYGEKLRYCKNRWEMCQVSMMERWSIFKITMFYFYLGIVNFSFSKSLESLWRKDFHAF